MLKSIGKQSGNPKSPILSIITVVLVYRHSTIGYRRSDILFTFFIICLYFFRTDSMDYPDCLPILLSISVFYFSVFLFPPF